MYSGAQHTCHVITCYCCHGAPPHTIVIRHHYHDASLYTIRQMLPLSWCSIVCCETSIATIRILHCTLLVPATLYQSAENHRIPSFLLSDAIVETVRVQINTILFIFYKDIFEHSKLESLCDISVTRIGDTLSWGFVIPLYVIPHCTLCAYVPRHA